MALSKKHQVKEDVTLQHNEKKKMWRFCHGAMHGSRALATAETVIEQSVMTERLLRSTTRIFFSYALEWQLQTRSAIQLI